jgi:5-formyltetrahydrofolate cyclo-ligase
MPYLSTRPPSPEEAGIIFLDSRMTNRERLRREMRIRRRRLAQPERDACAARLARIAAREPLIRNSRRVALYLPVNGEMDPQPLMDTLLSMGKLLYLPVLAKFPERSLWFFAYTPGDPLVCNRFGIPEPERVQDRRIRAAALDLALLPLVAFDVMGHRLGMGGGYYDYCFAFLNRRFHWRKPRLVGLAYEFQRLTLIDPEPWDVPLDAIATEQGVYHCR